MFAKLSRSWQFAKISYGILWDTKSLILFPILSTLAAGLVLASFIWPLWSLGLLGRWFGSGHGRAWAHDPVWWIVLFLFYFCSNFVIVFFNSALVACALRVVEDGQRPTLGYGFAAAVRRLPQILGWVTFSALVGVLLRLIESVNEKAGQIVASLLGIAWTAVTYFVVPVIIVEGTAAIPAVKRSAQVLKATWGEALVGNFTLNAITGLVILPLLVLTVVAVLAVALVANSPPAALIVGAAGVVLMILVFLANSAAEVILTAVLYNYATGKPLPATIDPSVLSDAFVAKK